MEGLINRGLNDYSRFSTIKTGMQWGHTNYSIKYSCLEMILLLER